MTLVEMYFVTPEGAPMINTPVEIQPSKASFDEEVEGIVMPRAVSTVTDAEGKVTVELWSVPAPYYVTAIDPLSDAGLVYKFLVPEVAVGVTVRLQDIVIEVDPPALPTGLTVEVVSNTEVRWSLMGTDGVIRTNTFTLA